MYQRRNDLFAVELDEPLNGRIGLFAFLEHCSEILLIKTRKREDAFLSKRQTEECTQRDTLLVERHRRELVGAAIALHTKLTGEEDVCAFQVLATVRTWAFRSLESVDHADAVDNDSELLLSHDGPRQSFVDLESCLCAARDGGRAGIGGAASADMGMVPRSFGEVVPEFRECHR